MSASVARAEPIAGAFFRARVDFAEPGRSAVTLGGVVDSLDHGAWRYVVPDSLYRLVGTGYSVREDLPFLTIYCSGDTVAWERRKTTAQGMVHLDVPFLRDQWIRWDSPGDSIMRAWAGDSTLFQRGERAGFALYDPHAMTTCVWVGDNVLESVSVVGDAEGLPYWIFTTGVMNDVNGRRWLTLVLTRQPPPFNTPLFIEPDEASMRGNYWPGSVVPDH